MRDAKTRKQTRERLRLDNKHQKKKSKEKISARNEKYEDWENIPEDQWTDERKNRHQVSA